MNIPLQTIDSLKHWLHEAKIKGKQTLLKICVWKSDSRDIEKWVGTYVKDFIDIFENRDLLPMSRNGEWNGFL